MSTFPFCWSGLYRSYVLRHIPLQSFVVNVCTVSLCPALFINDWLIEWLASSLVFNKSPLNLKVVLTLTHCSFQRSRWNLPNLSMSKVDKNRWNVYFSHGERDATAWFFFPASSINSLQEHQSLLLMGKAWCLYHTFYENHWNVRQNNSVNLPKSVIK